MRLKSFLPRDVYITGFSRTPIGSFLGSLSTLSSINLGSIALSNALKNSKIGAEEIDYLISSNVFYNGQGSLPIHNIASQAGVRPTVNIHGVSMGNVSGMKAICEAAQYIALFDSNNIVPVVGFESLSNVPYMCNIRSKKASLGNVELVDSIIADGLIDTNTNTHFGKYADKSAIKFLVGRVDQDKFSVESYKRATDAWKSGIMEKEIASVYVKNAMKKQSIESEMISISKDEEVFRLNLDRIAAAKSIYVKDGTITAHNSAKLGDGGAAIILMSEEKARDLHIQPIARILSFADASTKPEDFCTSPSFAIQEALSHANLKSVDYYEIDEIFSCVPLITMQILDLDDSTVNVHGGSISLGNPFGMTGCRIIISLMNVLMANDATYGCAVMCNGYGGSTAIIIEMI